MAFVERVDLRGRMHKIFEDDTNPRRKRLVACLHDQHYFDGAAWQDSDETFADDATDGYTVAAAKLRHIIRVGTTGTRKWIPRRDHPNEYITFGRLQSWSGTAWGNVNLGTPTRTGNQITWSVTAFDLSLTVTWRSVKILAVLKTEAARRRLRWAVTLNGMTYSNGDLISVSDGSVVGHVERPIAWDANGSIDNQNVTLTTTYSGGYLEFGGDLSAAVLPITIDPTLTIQPDGTAGKDCYLISTSPTTNTGSTVSFNIGSPDGSRKDRTLIAFDLTSLPSDATISSAILSIYANNDSSTNTSVLGVYRLKISWTESATWNTYNGIQNWQSGGASGVDDCETTDIGTKSLSDAETLNAFKDIVLSPMSKSSLDLGFGWMVRPTAENVANRYGYASSDNATPANRPKLVIDYTEGGAPTNYTLTAAQASFTFTGQSSLLQVARIMGATQAAYTLTGQAALLKRGYTLGATTRSYTLSGIAALLKRAYTLGATRQTYTLTGNSTLLKLAWYLAAARGTFTLTGNTANLNVGAGATAYTLTAAKGDFTLTGQAALLKIARYLTAAPTAYTLTRQPALLKLARKMPATRATFALTGRDVLLMRGYTLTAAPVKAITLTGNAAGFRVARKMPAGTGLFVLTGLAVGLFRRLPAAATPTERIYPVPAELRLYCVDGEIRVMVIPAETRILEV